jgi:2-keto-4-pentenoate hydratase/2-oxohepta-3-ene-1,7-dioic acid hydratase in catechol pathway
MVNLITNPDGSLPAVLGLSLSVHSRLAAHGQTMCVPAHFPQLQGGAELAVILGRGGRNISEVDAIGHIAGYSVFFGGVIYGLPPGQTVAIARNFDRTAPFGPELVTPDELPAGVAGLRMSLKRDGVIVQDGTVGQTWPVAAAIAGVSAAMTLEAGDVLTLGTLANARPDFLHEGETLEAEIAGIGTLRTVVVNNS